MLYAYLRVSTNEQNINRQLDKIAEYQKNYKVKIEENHIFIEKESGKDNDRAIYNRLRKKLKDGDELIILDLSRLSRKKPFLLREKAFFSELNIKLRVLNIPTTLVDFPDGSNWINIMVNNILFEVYSSIAEQEVVLISERTKDGLRAAAARGRYGGRPSKAITDIELALKMYKDGYYLSEIVKAINISRSCFYLYLDKKVMALIEINKEFDEIKELTGCTDEYIQNRINIKIE